MGPREQRALLLQLVILNAWGSANGWRRGASMPSYETRVPPHVCIGELCTEFC